MRASDANDDVVFGARLTSSAIVNEPQFVLTVALHALLASSFSVGGFSFPAPFGFGSGTFVQATAGVVAVVAGAVAVVAVVSAAVALFLALPQPTIATSARIGSTLESRRRFTARKHNRVAHSGSPVPAPPASSVRGWMDRDVALIVNPSAGRGRALRVLPDVERALAAQAIRFHVERTRDVEHARELAHLAGMAGEVAAACGGDGIAGAVADGLQGTDGLLAILPGGRGNDFARALGIPRDPVAACELIANGRERAIDLGEVDGRAFVGIASCGFDSDANRIANATRVPGDLAYLYGALRALASWRAARFELELDGVAYVHVGYNVAVANGRQYGGGMLIAPDAALDDGQFDVVTVADVPKRQFLMQLPKVFKGTHVGNPEVSVQRARAVRIAADRPFALYADGDPIADLPATVRTLPGAVRVLAA
jgi:YegS/Rv2252/BmrU family lipid kinase